MNSELYFKVAKVKGKDYLQIWDRSSGKCFHIGSAQKILKLVEVNPESLDDKIKLTKSQETRLTFQDTKADEKD